MQFGLNSLHFDSIPNYIYRNTPRRSSRMAALPYIGFHRLLSVAVELCGGLEAGVLRGKRTGARAEGKNEK